jgi:hypothetical protein
MHPRHNLNRRDFIRTILYHCRITFPDYNVAIVEPGIFFIFIFYL